MICLTVVHCADYALNHAQLTIVNRSARLLLVGAEVLRQAAFKYVTQLAGYQSSTAFTGAALCQNVDTVLAQSPRKLYDACQELATLSS